MSHILCTLAILLETEGSGSDGALPCCPHRRGLPFPAALRFHHQQPAHTFVTAFHGDARLRPPVLLPSAASLYSSHPFCHLCKAPLCCEGAAPHLTTSSEGAGHNHYVNDFPIFRENTACAVAAQLRPEWAGGQSWLCSTKGRARDVQAKLKKTLGRLF